MCFGIANCPFFSGKIQLFFTMSLDEEVSHTKVFEYSTRSVGGNRSSTLFV